MKVLEILKNLEIEYEMVDEATGHYRIEGISLWVKTGQFYDPKKEFKGKGIVNFVLYLKKKKLEQ